MTRSQQIKIYNAMNEAQRSRVADFMAAGLTRNTAISSVVMQDITMSKAPINMVTYSRSAV